MRIGRMLSNESVKGLPEMHDSAKGQIVLVPVIEIRA